MKLKTLCLLSAALLPAPLAAADNIADCEVLIAERIEDEATGGSALISSYRPAAAFISSVYDEEPGHIRKIDGHKIRAVLCQRRRAIPTLRDYPLLETGIPLTLSQNFDSSLSDVVIVRFKDGAFRSDYTGPGLSPDEAAELEDVLEIYNLQPNDLAAREAEQKQEEALEADAAPDIAPEIAPNVSSDISSEPLTATAPVEFVAETAPFVETSPDVAQSPEPEVTLSQSENNTAPNAVEIITLETNAEEAPEIESASETAPDNVAEADDLEAAVLPIDNAGRKANNVEGPPAIGASDALDICRIIGRDALGQIQEIPISAQGLQNTLETAPVFVFPTPPGLNLRAVKCLRATLTPGANDYKVARAGYPFFYQVEGDNKRVAALEFAGGKFRMNLLEGEFTSQELIDAKARILSFNDQHLKDLEQQRKSVP